MPEPSCRVNAGIIHVFSGSVSPSGSANGFQASTPTFERFHQSAKDGTETHKSLGFNSRRSYREDFVRELAEIDNQEIWRAGKAARSLRPDAQNQAVGMYND